MHKLAYGFVALLFMAGCAQPTQPESNWCSGSRDVFHALAPGMSALLEQQPLVDSYNVTDLPLLVPSLPINVSLPWAGAGLGSITWTFEAGEGYPNSAGGFVELSLSTASPVLAMQFPEDLPSTDRITVVVQFLENTTLSDAQARRALAALAVTRALPDVLVSSGQVADGKGPVTYETNQPVPEETPVSLPLRLSPLLDGGLQTPDALNKEAGYQQAMFGQYTLNVYVPQRAARGHLGSAAFEVRADAQDIAAVAILSPAHDAQEAVRLRDAALALVGYKYNGNTTWDGGGRHDDHAPIEVWREACR